MNRGVVHVDINYPRLVASITDVFSFDQHTSINVSDHEEKVSNNPASLLKVCLVYLTASDQVLALF